MLLILPKFQAEQQIISHGRGMERNSIKICAPELYSNVSYNVFSIYLLTPTDTVYHNDIKMTTLKVKYYS